MSAPAVPTNGAGDARDPSGFLSEIIGAPVTVKLNSGVVYRGRSTLSFHQLVQVFSGNWKQELGSGLDQVARDG